MINILNIINFNQLSARLHGRRVSGPRSTLRPKNQQHSRQKGQFLWPLVNSAVPDCSSDGDSPASASFPAVCLGEWTPYSWDGCQSPEPHSTPGRWVRPPRCQLRRMRSSRQRAPSTGAFMSSPEAREHPFSLPKTQIWDQLPPRVAPRGRVCRKSPIHPPTAEKHLYCRQARWLTRVVKTLLKIIVQRRGRTTSTKITKQLSDVGRQPQAAQITSKSKSWWEEEKYKSMIRCDPPPLGMGGRLQCEKVECVILVREGCRKAPFP